MTTYRLDLPWPAPPMLDNNRLHWARKAALTKELRDGANVLARAAKLPRGLERVLIRLVWQPAVKRRRDPWCTAPTLKPLIDGLVDYGLVVDDDTEHVEPDTQVLDAVRGAARLWLEIETTKVPPVSDEPVTLAQIVAALEQTYKPRGVLMLLHQERGLLDNLNALAKIVARIDGYDPRGFVVTVPA